jgi:hypothetical protein
VSEIAAEGGDPEKVPKFNRAVKGPAVAPEPTAGFITLNNVNLIGTFPSFLIVKVTKTVVPPPGAVAPPLIFKLTLVAPPAKNPVT